MCIVNLNNFQNKNSVKFRFLRNILKYLKYILNGKKLFISIYFANIYNNIFRKKN